jgi:hypothetical protein
VVDRAYEAFGQGDVAGVLDLLAEYVHWSTPADRLMSSLTQA